MIADSMEGVRLHHLKYDQHFHLQVVDCAIDSAPCFATRAMASTCCSSPAADSALPRPSRSCCLFVPAAHQRHHGYWRCPKFSALQERCCAFLKLVRLCAPSESQSAGYHFRPEDFDGMGAGRRFSLFGDWCPRTTEGSGTASLYERLCMEWRGHACDPKTV